MLWIVALYAQFNHTCCIKYIFTETILLADTKNDASYNDTLRW